MVEELFGELTVEQVREASGRWATSELLAVFDRYQGYRSAGQWNELVRVCEALAVVGWGEREPVEAFAERWINGSFYTQLRNRQFEIVGGSERRWSRHGTTFTLTGDEGESSPPAGEAVTGLLSQRIPLAKNPVRLVRSGNYQAEAKPFVDELARLRGLLDRRLGRPYGPGFGHLGFRLNFSYPAAGPGLATEYFHDEIGPPAAPGARPFVRARLETGRLTVARGELTCTATRHYTDAEARQGLAEQKRGFAADLETVFDELAKKLRRKAPDYRLTELRTDTTAVVAEWLV